MNTLRLFSVIAVIIALSSVAKAEGAKETIKVYGNCEMCQKRIEKAATDAGASTAKWNAETQILTVSYSSAKTNLKKIEERVASVGHDTEHAVAPNEVYNKLHGCCQYERKEKGVTLNPCCAAGASCCTSQNECCSKASVAFVDDCCKAGAACYSKVQACCKKVAAASIADCCKPAASCCNTSEACCSPSALKFAA